MSLIRQFNALVKVIMIMGIGNVSLAETTDFEERRQDWRIGAMTYQVFVDRFAPAVDLAAKKHLYKAPKTLRPWAETPKRESPSPDSILWEHELAFWGGDLVSLTAKIDYLKQLGMDVVYLNPIVEAQSNHKYDAIDLYQIAPEYGSSTDLKRLADNLKQVDMRLVLDGVFNHVGYQSHWFQDALNNTDSPYRDWFYFDENVQNGYVGWWGVENLPELNWNNPEVLNEIALKPNSVVRKFFEYGIDGWRLDVATELGFEHLQSITNAALEEKSDSLVIGEVWSYPKDWTSSLNAVMNFTMRQLMFRFVEGKLSANVFNAQLVQMISDSGIEPLLRSWLILDNHDLPRLKTRFPDSKHQAMLQTLQMTLPGSPLIYYGVEVGMEGGDDPENRAPMRWDLLTETNPDYQRFQKLITLRADNPALKIGNYQPVAAAHSLAFLRTTDKVEETLLIVVNADKSSVTETLMLPDARLMNGEIYQDLLSDAEISSRASVVTFDVPAQSVMILKPKRWKDHTKRTGHSPYKHIK